MAYKAQLEHSWVVRYSPAIAFWILIVTLIVVTVMFYVDDDCSENQISLDEQMISDYLCCSPERVVGLVGFTLTGIAALVASNAVWDLLNLTYPSWHHSNRTCASFICLASIGMIGLSIFTICSTYIIHLCFAGLAFIFGALFTVWYNLSFMLGPAIPCPSAPLVVHWAQSNIFRGTLSFLSVFTTCYWGWPLELLFTEWLGVLVLAAQIGAVVQADVLFPPLNPALSLGEYQPINGSDDGADDDCGGGGDGDGVVRNGGVEYSATRVPPPI